MDYVRSVFDPTAGPARIPESFARPTAIWQHKFSGTLKSSVQNGQLYGYFNPHNIVYNTSSNIMMAYKDASTTAVMDIETPVATNITADTTVAVPDYANKFTHVRVVSAEMKLSYYGRTDERSGMLFASVMSNSISYASGSASIISQLEDGHFFYSGSAEDGLCMKVLPYDKQLLEFQVRNSAQDEDTTGIAWFFCAIGLPKNQSLFRYEIVVNVEGIVHPTFAEYVQLQRNITDQGEESYRAINHISHIYPKLVVSSVRDKQDINEVLRNEAGRRAVAARSSTNLPGFK